MPVRPHTLRQYALIADGERGGVLGPEGDLVWLCAPRWDSPAVFAALLGGEGSYCLAPSDPWRVWGGFYEPGTLIWRSRWVGDAETECREALAMPADEHRVVVLRRVEALARRAKVSAVLDVRAGFGRHKMTGLRQDGGCWSGRSGPLRFRWSGAPDARATGDGLCLDLDIAEGRHHDLVLEISDQPFQDDPPDPQVLWNATEQAWAGAVPECGDLIAARDARHAYAVLCGLTSGSGAMVAAATTSLPERLDGGRDYDYRYAWIRDQCYMGLAVAAHGPHPLLDASVGFITARLLADGPGLRPAYTVAGENIPGEDELGLRGYPGGVAKTGNRVSGQFQLDGLGEALQLIAAAARWDRIGGQEWEAARIAARAIGQRWRDADAGLWELDDQRWAHSRLACAAGLRAIAAAAGGAGRSDAARWSGLADTILADLGDCVHASGRWQRSPTDERVDASLLLPSIRGAIPADDPRGEATFRAVEDELADDGYVYRFRHDARPLHQAEGAWPLCGFWLALAAWRRGDEVAARHWFERNRAACGPAGLFAEEYDVHQRQLRGNLPQAFVHATMLECAATLSRARKEDAGQ